MSNGGYDLQFHARQYFEHYLRNVNQSEVNIIANQSEK